MLGTSLRLSVCVLTLWVIFSSVAVGSAGVEPGDAHNFLRRFYRTESKAESALPKAAQASDPSSKPSADESKKDAKEPDDHKNENVSGEDDKNNKDVKSASSSPNVSLPSNMTGKEEIRSGVSAGGAQHNLNSGALLRGFYVFVGLSTIVVIYIVVRAISVRRKKTTVRKYGILANREDVEMTPLGAEDDDEDTTLFDVSNQTRP